MLHIFFRKGMLWFGLFCVIMSLNLAPWLLLMLLKVAALLPCFPLALFQQALFTNVDVYPLEGSPSSGPNPLWASPWHLVLSCPSLQGGICWCWHRFVLVMKSSSDTSRLFQNLRDSFKWTWPFPHPTGATEAKPPSLEAQIPLGASHCLQLPSQILKPCELVFVQGNWI